MNKSEVPGARKEFRGKDTGAEAKYQEQGKNLRETRGNRREVPGAMKKSKGKEKGTEVKCQEQGKNIREKRREQKQSARSNERI